MLIKCYLAPFTCGLKVKKFLHLKQECYFNEWIAKLLVDAPRWKREALSLSIFKGSLLAPQQISQFFRVFNDF